ncbi:MAG: HAD-IA family hydrolase [Gammaproteobacteria bacterium]|nr:HAD-IA family hydrolase [Gammaproteobacteria bacterium]
MTMPGLRAALFDLDGTLADTAPDLAYALNCVIEEQGKDPLPYATIRPHVSHGASALIRLGFPELLASSGEFDQCRQRLLAVYRDNIALHTRLFAGMDLLLDWLDGQGLKWGVVTNKPAWLTQPLMEQLGLATRAACIVSGDTTALRKPDPQPMFHACQLMGLAAADCLFIGDAERDIEAGRRAGMKTLVALFGYLGNNDHPEQWQADDMVEQPQQIIDWIVGYNQQRRRS